MAKTKRGVRASHESQIGLAAMAPMMAQALELDTIGNEQTPAITRLLSHEFDKVSETADRLKPIRFRKRPYVHLSPRRQTCR